jgi:hypothetical protein
MGTGSTLVGALSELCAISVKAVGGIAISSEPPVDNGAPHWEHHLAQTTLIASHREHRVRFSGDPHSLQTFDPSGLPWAQKLQARPDIWYGGDA